MNEPIQPKPTTVEELLESIRKNPMYLELRPSTQRSVEEGIRSDWGKLHNPHDVLPEILLQQERKRYLDEGALQLLKNIWDGTRAVEEVLNRRITVERDAEKIAKVNAG